MFKYSVAFIGLASQAVRAIPTIPEPTDASRNVLDGQGWSPAPTGLPHMEMMKRGGLSPRQLSVGQLIGRFAPDNTCGFVSGAYGASKTCDSTQRCAAVAPIAGVAGDIGCCGTAVNDGCTWYGTCIDRAGYSTSSACDRACQQNANIVKCTAASKPFCYAFTMASLSAIFYQCDTTTGRDTVFTTFTGQQNAQTWSPVYYTGSSSGGVASVGGSSGLVGIFTGRTGNGVDSVFASSTTSANPTTSSTTPARKGSSTPVGAIVGGVVGGVAVIGAIVAGVIFLLLRKKKKSKASHAAEAAQGPPPSYPSQAPMQQQQPAMGYAQPPADPRMSYYPTQDQKMNMGAPTDISSPASPAPTHTTAMTYMSSPTEQQGPYGQGFQQQPQQGGGLLYPQGQPMYQQNAQQPQPGAQNFPAEVPNSQVPNPQQQRSEHFELPVSRN